MIRSASGWRTDGVGISLKRFEGLLISVLSVLVVLPSVVWVLMDQTAWAWDQAWYGKYSVDLFSALVHSPSEWPSTMLEVFVGRPPGIAWVGQFFVPAGMLIGSIDSGLLLSIVAAQAFGVMMMTRAVWELSSRRFRSVIIGLIVMASSPLFIALSHYYLVETMQTAAVCWFVLIMALSPRWSRLRTMSQLGLATSYAMLAKASSPLYCVGPGLVALYVVVRSQRKDDSRETMTTVVMATSAVCLGLATATWYYLNYQAVLAHMAMSASGRVAELYFEQEPFLTNLKLRLLAIRADFFASFAAIAAIGCTLAAVVVSIVKGAPAEKRLTLATQVALLQIVTTLAVLSVNSNRDDRYMLPLLPYFVLVICWAVERLNLRVVTVAVIVAFTYQGVNAHLAAFGVVRRAPDAPEWLNPVNTNSGNVALLNALVSATCAEKTAQFYWNAVGVQLLWLNPPAVAYAAAKQFGPRNALHCDYAAIGYYESDKDQAWRELMGRQITYYITVDPDVHKAPETLAGQTINSLNEPILQMIERSGLFELQQTAADFHGVLVFKRTDRVDHLAQGRALSDRGNHQRAIEELRQAATADPNNVEVWANLALAYERQGDLDQAEAAGRRAAQLAPNHYWVNLGLARVFLLDHDWTNAVDRAESAVANAPGDQERANAVILAARGWFKAGDNTKGCDRLKRFDLSSRPEILNEIATHGCVR